MGRLLPILFLIDLVLIVIALVSCLSAEESDIRALPRFAWVLIILLFPPVGPIVWFVAGKERYSTPRGNTWRPGAGFPEAERPGRTLAPDDNPEFLRELDVSRSEQDAAQHAEQERELLRKWEDDLRRREDDLKKNKPDEDG